jgi:arginase
MDMNVRLLHVPYDSARRDLRTGRGPTWLVEHGAVAVLQQAGHAVTIAPIESTSAFPSEIATSFELARLVSAAVRDSAADSWFPLVLSGNCNTALGTVAGLGEGTGILWLDAHGESETPDTTASGLLDGMGLAILTGRCWAGLAAAVPGFRPVPGGDVVLVGTRSVSPAETRLFRESGITLVTVEDVRRAGVVAALAPHLDRLRRRVQRLYVHVDADVHDPDAVAPANGFAEPGGLTAEEVREVVAGAGRTLPVVAAGVASFDPSFDRESRMVGAILDLLPVLVAASVSEKSPR